MRSVAGNKWAWGSVSIPCILTYFRNHIAAGQSAGVPHLPDGRPDLNGVWQIPYTPDMSRGVEGGLPFTTWGAADFKAYDAAKFDYTGHCLPQGLTQDSTTCTVDSTAPGQTSLDGPSVSASGTVVRALACDTQHVKAPSAEATPVTFN